MESNNAEEREKWKQMDKHIFLLTSSGKPIYSRHGKTHKLAGLMGVLVGLISFVEDNNDQIRAVSAGKHKFVFSIHGPIYCAIVSQTDESVGQLMSQLNYMHSQIISILTNSAHRILRDKPQFDLRNLLGGTDRYLHNLANLLNEGPAMLLNSIHCLRMPSQARTLAGQIMMSEREGNDIFYALLIANGQLVNLVRPKRHLLSPPDLHLLINFVNSSTAFKESEACLTPICLPTFDDRGFLHLYVCYLNEQKTIALLLLSSRPEDFPQMSATKDRIHAALMSETNKTMVHIEEALKHQYYSVESMNIPELVHFLYKSHSNSQMTSPIIGPPFNSVDQKRRLFRLYEQVHHTSHLLDKPHKVYFHRGEAEIIVSWIVPDAFDLYAIFSPLASKQNAIKACNLLLKWIRNEENNLFITTSPVWGA